MVLDLLLILLGLALLVGGGEALVRGASGLALLARVTPAVVGLTVVAAGTSFPELVVSIQSALEGRPGLALGNVVGSNIFNIGAILGLTALLRPLRISGQTVRLEWPVMLIAALELHLLSRDGVVDRLEGGFLIVGQVAFTAWLVHVGRRAAAAPEREAWGELATASSGRTGRAAWAANGAAILLGVALLAGGSSALVRGASSLAAGLGVSDTVIGLTIVAGGTSTPELVTSIVAALRGRDDVAVGNIVGSNVFNALFIAGGAALVRPLPVPPELIARDCWWMAGFSLALLPLIRSGMRMSRPEGGLLLLAYLVYLGSLLAPGPG